jgi:hypothetical protein
VRGRGEPCKTSVTSFLTSHLVWPHQCNPEATSFLTWVGSIRCWGIRPFPWTIFPFYALLTPYLYSTVQYIQSRQHIPSFVGRTSIRLADALCSRARSLIIFNQLDRTHQSTAPLQVGWSWTTSDETDDACSGRMGGCKSRAALLQPAGGKKPDQPVSPARLAGPLLDPASTGDGIGNLKHGGCSASWLPGASLSLCCQPRDFRGGKGGGEGGGKYSEDRTVDTVQYLQYSVQSVIFNRRYGWYGWNGWVTPSWLISDVTRIGRLWVMTEFHQRPMPQQGPGTRAEIPPEPHSHRHHRPQRRSKAPHTQQSATVQALTRPPPGHEPFRSSPYPWLQTGPYSMCFDVLYCTVQDGTIHLDQGTRVMRNPLLPRRLSPTEVGGKPLIVTIANIKSLRTVQCSAVRCGAGGRGTEKGSDAARANKRFDVADGTVATLTPSGHIIPPPRPSLSFDAVARGARLGPSRRGMEKWRKKGGKGLKRGAKFLVPPVPLGRPHHHAVAAARCDSMRLDATTPDMWPTHDRTVLLLTAHSTWNACNAEQWAYWSLTN